MQSNTNEIIEFLRNNIGSYEHVIVYGSHARGEAYSSSDFDVLLIDDRFDGWLVKAEGDDSVLDFSWKEEFPPIHIVCCSPEEFESRYCNDSEMVSKVVEEGFDVEETFALTDYVNSIEC